MGGLEQLGGSGGVAVVKMSARHGLTGADIREASLALVDTASITWAVTDDAGDGLIEVQAMAAGGSADLLTAVYYDPASVVNVTSTSATFSALDTTHLRATFNAPASGSVTVRFGCSLSAVSGAQPYLGVLEGSTVRAAIQGLFVAGTSQVNAYTTGSQRITGLTPGAPFSWDLAGANGAGATGTAKLTYGGGVGTAGVGPAFIEISQS